MVRTSGSTVSRAAPPTASQPAGTVTAPSACTRRRSRAGITCTTLASARTDASAMPSTAPGAPAPCAAACRPRARATASSSSTTSGGKAEPAASW